MSGDSKKLVACSRKQPNQNQGGGPSLLIGGGDQQPNPNQGGGPSLLIGGGDQQTNPNQGGGLSLLLHLFVSGMPLCHGLPPQPCGNKLMDRLQMVDWDAHA